MEVGALYSHFAITNGLLLGDMDSVSHFVMVKEPLVNKYDPISRGVGVAIDNEHVESASGNFALNMILIEEPRNSES